MAAQNPGTDEVGVMMRHDTNAMRVRYGLPIFVTVSPDEKHSALLLRLSRTRRTDPILEHDTVGAVVAGIHDPPLGRDLVILALDEEALCEIIPRYRVRRKCQSI